MCRLRKLRTLGISNSELKDEDLTLIAHLTNLESLCIADDTEVTDRGLTFLRPLVKLEALILDEDSVTDQGIEQLRFLPKLRTLSVCWTSKYGRTGIHGCTLSNLAGLQVLCIEGANLTTKGFEQLSMIQGLRELSTDAPVNDERARFLAKLTKLKLLDIGETSDSAIARLKPLHKLVSLYASGTGITDKGLLFLTTMPSLQHAILSSTSVTSQGVAKARQLAARDWQIVPARPGSN